MALTSTVKKELYQFFAIAFDAAPGVTYMGQMAEAIGAGMTVKQVVNVFTTKPEFTSVYPNFFTNEQFATKLVNNVVGNSADASAKAAAVADIAAALNAGWSRGDVIYQVFTNLANKPETDTTWGNTAKQMANQVAYAEYYTEELLTDTTNLTSLRAVIANVTQDTDVSTAAIAAALAPAATYATSTLGTGIDTIITTSASVNTIDGSTTANTLSSSDSITDASGSDSDKLVARFTTNQSSVRPTITDIEKIEVQADAANVTMDLTRATGYDNLQVNAQNFVDGNGVYFTNVANGGVGLTVSALNASNETVGVQYTDAALAGTNSLSLTLDTVSAGNVSLSDAGGTTNILEQVAITTAVGASSFQLIDGGVNLKTITLSGDQNLTLAVSGMGNLSTISGADFTGALNTALNGNGLTVTTGSGADSITGGSGNDTIITNAGADVITNIGSGTDVVSAGAGADTIVVAGTGNATIYGGDDADTINMATYLTAGDKVYGGDGSDTVILTGSVGQSVLGATLNSVEKVALNAANITLDLNSADVSALSSGVTVDLTSAGNQTVNLQAGTGAFTGQVTVDMTSGSGNETVNAAGSTGTISVIGKVFDIQSADTIIGGNGADALTLTADSNSAGADLSNVTKVESVVIAASTNKTAKIAALNSSDTTNMTIDATALTNTSASLTVVGSGYSGNLTVSGGAGADSITAGNGNDAIYGGSGNDTIVFAAGKFTGNDVVSGGGGVDTLSLADTTINAASTALVSSDLEIIKLTGTNATMAMNNADVALITVDLTSADNQTLTLDSGNGTAYAGSVTVVMTGGAGNDKVDATNSSGTIAVVGKVADIGTADTIIGGNGTDTLTLSADNGTADFAAVSKVETVTITAGATADCDAAITLGGDTTNMTIDASALTNVNATLTVTGTSYGGKLTITGGNGADSITGGNGADLISTGYGADSVTVGCGADTVSAGAGADTIVLIGTGNATIYGEDGDDTINMASYLTAGDVVVGGAGNDTLVITADVTSGKFAGVSGVETVSLKGAGTDLTLNSADAAGFSSGVTVDLTDAGNQSVTLASGTGGFTGSVTVKMTGGAGNDTIDATNSSGTIAVAGKVADIGTADTIIGGNGTDTLTLSADNGTADFAAVSKVETVTITAGATADCDAAITLGGDTTNMTIDASALTNVNATLTVTGTSYGGKLTITGGNGADSITGGNGADLISTGYGADSVTVGCGADTVSAGAGADTIVLIGTGNATIYGEDGDDTINMASYLTAGDVVVGGAGNDTLVITADVTSGKFAGVSGVETVSLKGAGTDLTLNSADAAGFSSGVTVDLTDAGNQSVTLASGTGGFTGSVTVKMTGGAGNDTIDATNSSGTIAVAGKVADIGTADTIIGGNGTDTLTLSADNGTADFAAVSKVETVTITAGATADCDAAITLGGDTTNMTIDASALTNVNATLTVTGTSYGGKLTITGGNGADSITGGNGADLISTGYGADSVTIGCGADTVSAGAGTDTIVVIGTGNASIYGDAGNDTITLSNYLSTGDVVDGGADYDTLNVSGTIAAGSLVGVANVEKLALVGTTTLNLNIADNVAFDGTGVTIDVTNSADQSVDFGSGSRAFSGSVTVNMMGGSGNESIVTNNSTGTVAIIGNVGDILAGDSVTAGGHSTDTITLYADDCSADFANVRGITAVTVTARDGNDATLTLGGDTEALTINASSMTNTAAVLTVAGAAYGGRLSITSGAGADSIVGGNAADYIMTGLGNDSITGGCGADTVVSGDGSDVITVSGSGSIQVDAGADNDTLAFGAYLNSDDIVEGGTGFDTITLSGTTVAGSFGSVTGIEKVSVSGAAATLNLSSLDTSAFALSSGSVTVDLTANTNQVLNLSSGATGFTGNLIVDITGGLNDKIDATNSSATFSVVGKVSDVSVGDTIIGGNGTDTLTLSADNGTANFTNVSKVETVTITAGTTADCDASITLGSATTALTIDATALVNSGATLSVNGATYGGALTITGGNGADSFTGGSGADLIVGGNGNDVLLGGAGSDTISGGAGFDSIVGGAGSDILYGGNGNDNFYFSANGVVSLDSVMDWVGGTGNDTIQIDQASGWTWGNASSVTHDSSDGIASNAAIIFLNESSAFNSLAEASALADQLFVMNGSDDTNGGAYVFVWQDTSGTLHISYGESVIGQDSAKDVVKLVGVSLSAFMTGYTGGPGGIDLV